MKTKRTKKKRSEEWCYTGGDSNGGDIVDGNGIAIAGSGDWGGLIQSNDAALICSAPKMRKALHLALASLEEIQLDGWTIRQECGNDDCLICPGKAEARKRALAAIDALKKELER